jgi:hypothetical protein
MDGPSFRYGVFGEEIKNNKYIQNETKLLTQTASEVILD